MDIPDIWSIVTGTAGLISFFLSLGDRFSRWRIYTIPAATGLVGFAIGRISPVLMIGTDQLFSEPRTVGFFLLFFLILTVLLLIAHGFMKREQFGFAYMVILMGLIFIPTFIMPMFTETFESVPAGDYVKLAQLKIDVKEYDDAIRYLELAKKNTKNEEFRSRLEERIKEILKREAGSLSDNLDD